VLGDGRDEMTATISTAAAWAFGASGRSGATPDPGDPVQTSFALHERPRTG